MNPEMIVDYLYSRKFGNTFLINRRTTSLPLLKEIILRGFQVQSQTGFLSPYMRDYTIGSGFADGIGSKLGGFGSGFSFGFGGSNHFNSGGSNFDEDNTGEGSSIGEGDCGSQGFNKWVVGDTKESVICLI